MLSDLKKEYLDLETPCYILDESKLNKNYEDLAGAFSKKWNNIIIGYSFKTNSLPYVLTYLRDKGAYAEVVSEPEYRLAIELGFKKDNVILNGPYKGFKALEECLNDGAIVNLDSFHEIEWLKNNVPDKGKVWKVGIRINFDLERFCPGETIMGEEPGRFGFNIENGSFNKALEELSKLSYVKVVGLHGHHSTKTKSLKVFKEISKMLVECAKSINDDIEYIDIGGCIFGDKPGAPTFDEYADTIVQEIKSFFNEKKVALILEPGAALIASPFKYLCKVIDKKDVLDKRIVTTDGSCIHIDPQMHGIKFYQESFGSGENYPKNQIISGFTCIEKDRMATLNNCNELNDGDYILFHNTGAYSMALSPLFIQYYPNIYTEKKNELKLIRKKWSVRDYIINSIY